MNSHLMIQCNLHIPILISSLVSPCYFPRGILKYQATNSEGLEDDEREAINKSNIMRGDRLRHAKPRTMNKYNEGPDESDLPAGLE